MPHGGGEEGAAVDRERSTGAVLCSANSQRGKKWDRLKGNFPAHRSFTWGAAAGVAMEREDRLFPLGL